MINRIYSAVVSGSAPDEVNDWYYKKHAACPVTEKGRKLQAIMLAATPSTHVCLMACVVSWMSLYSVFADMVEEVDPENTYAPPVSHSGMTVHQCMVPVDQLSAGVQLLDEDLRARLTMPTWFDLMTAFCLQILRG